MSLPASLVDTPMYDGTGKLSFAWIQKFGQIGQTAPVQALLYGSSADRKVANKAELPDGVLWFELDTEALYRLEYLDSGAAWIVLDYVQGASNLTDPGRMVMVGADGEVTEAPFASADVVLGAPNLTHAGQVPKVSAAGTVTESSILDDGTTVTIAGENVRIADVAPPAGPYPLHIVRAETSPTLAGLQQLAITTFNHPAFNLFIGYGNPGIGANVGALQAWAGGGTALALNPSGGHVGIGTATPGYALDTTGDINASGIYRKGGAGGITQNVPLAKITTGGVNGFLTITGGIITGYSNPT